MDEIIEDRIIECALESKAYERWLKILRFPNLILVGGGSLLAFLGGAAIISSKFDAAAGYMALVGGALTGLHGWLGCESHQQKCRTIAAQYMVFKMKYEALLVADPENKKEKLTALQDQYTEFILSIDVKPWF